MNLNSCIHKQRRAASPRPMWMSTCNKLEREGVEHWAQWRHSTGSTVNTTTQLNQTCTTISGLQLELGFACLRITDSISTTLRCILHYHLVMSISKDQGFGAHAGAFLSNAPSANESRGYDRLEKTRMLAVLAEEYESVIVSVDRKAMDRITK